jgi:two-component system OmpR family sensor kinase
VVAAADAADGAERKRSQPVEGTAHTLGIVAGGRVMRLDATALGEQPRGRSVVSIDAAQAALVAVEAEDPREDESELAIAWTAHELRGPLLGLKVALEMLGECRPTERVALLDRCRAEVDRLSTLVSDTLRWGIAGDPPRTRDCDLVPVVEEAIEECRLESGDDRVVLLAPPRARARVDAVQLRSAVANLVRNALSYSPPAGRVEVIVSVDDESVTVAVRNRGSAITTEDQQTIFLPFVRGANAGGRFGKGLGLFIARRIAEANRGRLSLVSQDGTTEFRIELPGVGR